MRAEHDGPPSSAHRSLLLPPSPKKCSPPHSPSPRSRVSSPQPCHCSSAGWHRVAAGAVHLIRFSRRGQRTSPALRARHPSQLGGGGAGAAGGLRAHRAGPDPPPQRLRPARLVPPRPVPSLTPAASPPHPSLTLLVPSHGPSHSLTLLLASLSASFSNNNLTTSRWPPELARMRAVFPSWVPEGRGGGERVIALETKMETKITNPSSSFLPQSPIYSRLLTLSRASLSAFASNNNLATSR